MANLLDLTIAFAAGLSMGLLYFGGLWLTVQRLPQARQPVLLTFSSLAVRLALLLGGLYLVSEGRWVKIGVYMLGVLITRTLVIQKWGPTDAPQQGKDA